MALSPTQLDEYWSLLDEVNRLAQEDLVALWRSLEDLDQDRLWAALRAGVPEIVTLYRATAADTAMLFYEETQGLEFSREDALAASTVNAAQLESNLRWALFNEGNTEILGLIAGVVQKHVVDGSRAYALSGFTNAGTGWYRAARPGACNFCRLLATRAVTEWGPYGSADAAAYVGRGRSSASFSSRQARSSSKKSGQGARPVGGTFHKNCSCIPVKASEYQRPSYVDTWTDQYYAATGNVGNALDTEAILSEMRKISGHNH